MRQKIICEYDNETGNVYTKAPFGEIFVGYADPENIQLAPDIEAIEAKIDKMLSLIDPELKPPAP